MIDSASWICTRPSSFASPDPPAIASTCSRPGWIFMHHGPGLRTLASAANRVLARPLVPQSEQQIPGSCRNRYPGMPGPCGLRYLAALGGGLVDALVSLLLPVPDVPEVNGVRVSVPGQGELPASWRRDFDFGGIDLPW
jgi:hypothetical protein